MQQQMHMLPHEHLQANTVASKLLPHIL